MNHQRPFYRTERRLPGYKPVELSNTVNALAKLGHMPSATWLDAFTAAAAKLVGGAGNAREPYRASGNAARWPSRWVGRGRRPADGRMVMGVGPARVVMRERSWRHTDTNRALHAKFEGHAAAQGIWSRLSGRSHWCICRGRHGRKGLLGLGCGPLSGA